MEICLIQNLRTISPTNKVTLSKMYFCYRMYVGACNNTFVVKDLYHYRDLGMGTGTRYETYSFSP
jgi:hypothetical protein